MLFTVYASGGKSIHLLEAVGAPPVLDAATDRVALMQLFEATGGTSWKNNTGWGTSGPLGDWHGVTVDDAGRVIKLELAQNKLTGGSQVSNSFLEGSSPQQRGYRERAFGPSVQ